MRKPRDLLFKIFVARLTKVNNYLPLFPGLSVIKKMNPEDIKKKFSAPSLTLGHNNPTYRGGILRIGTTSILVTCLNAWKSLKQYMKEE